MGRRTRGDGCEASLDRPRTASRKPVGTELEFRGKKTQAQQHPTYELLPLQTPSNKDI
jgi:hypothetical protein